MQQLTQLLPVCGSLIEQHQELGVCKHEPRRLRAQTFLHVLRRGGQDAAVFSEPLPGPVKHFCGVVVFEVQIDLVQEHPGVFSLFAVFHDPVVDGLQRHHQRGGAKLLSHLVQVKNHDPVGHIHIGVMGEHVQTALGDQFRRKGDLPRLRFRLLQHLPAPIGEQRCRRLAAETGLKYAGCAAVNDGFVAAAHDPGPHLLLQNQAADLCNYVFFSDNELPKQIAPDAPELNNNKLKEFLLRMSLIYNEGFFAKKVMLIEGSSDMIICRYLCNRLDFNLDVAGSQIIPVEGKGQFPVITKLFRLIGKDVCVLTDLDGFIDDNSVVDLFSSLPKATEIANRRGVSNLQTMIRDIKTTIDKLISENKQDIATIYELHPYWVNRDSEADPDKVIRRALIAQLFTVSEDTLLTWPNSNDWKSIKTRITALYDILEELGCFILRRGAIESYYTFAPNTTFSGKPSAATLEVSHLEEESNAQICEQFADLVRALRFAAIDKPVDESFAVKKELLSELALVIGVLPNTDREEDLLSDIKQAKGNSESLFDYKIINENGRLGVEVFLKSKIINVSGFPFKAFVDDNVNQIVSAHVRMKN